MPLLQELSWRLEGRTGAGRGSWASHFGASGIDPRMVLGIRTGPHRLTASGHPGAALVSSVTGCAWSSRLVATGSGDALTAAALPDRRVRLAWFRPEEPAAPSRVLDLDLPPPSSREPTPGFEPIDWQTCLPWLSPDGRWIAVVEQTAVAYGADRHIADAGILHIGPLSETGDDPNPRAGSRPWVQVPWQRAVRIPEGPMRPVPIFLPSLPMVLFPMREVVHATPDVIPGDDRVLGFAPGTGQVSLLWSEPGFDSYDWTPLDAGRRLAVLRVGSGTVSEPDRTSLWVFGAGRTLIPLASRALPVGSAPFRLQADPSGPGLVVTSEDRILGLDSATLERTWEWALPSWSRGAEPVGADRGARLFALAATFLPRSRWRSEVEPPSSPWILRRYLDDPRGEAIPGAHHAAPVVALRLSDSGIRLSTLDAEGGATILDTATGVLLARFEGCRAVPWVPEDGSGPVVFDRAGLHRLRTLAGGPAWTLPIDPDEPAAALVRFSSGDLVVARAGRLPERLGLAGLDPRGNLGVTVDRPLLAPVTGDPGALVVGDPDKEYLSVLRLDGSGLRGWNRFPDAGVFSDWTTLGFRARPPDALIVHGHCVPTLLSLGTGASGPLVAAGSIPYSGAWLMPDGRSLLRVAAGAVEIMDPERDPDRPVRIALDDLCVPGDIAISPDGRTAYLAQGGHVRRVSMPERENSIPAA